MRHVLAFAALLALIVSASAHAAIPPDLKTIERHARLLASPVSKDRAEAEEWLKHNGEESFAILIRLIQQGDMTDQPRAAHAAVLLISPWMRGIEAGFNHKGQIELYVPARQTGRPVDHPKAPALRKAAIEALQKLLTERRKPPVNDDNGKNPAFPGWQAQTQVKGLCELLIEVADAPTADRVAGLLAEENDRYLASALMGMLDAYHGRPVTHHQGFMCGTGATPESIAQFERDETKRCMEAKATLLQWHKAHAGKPLKQRIIAVLDLWDAWVNNPNAGVNLNNGEWLTNFPWYTSLFRLGEPAVDELQQRLGTIPREATARRALYEVAITVITGKLDKDRVASLLKGGTLEKLLACELIVAAGSRDFKEELGRLVQGTDANMRASYALACVHRLDAIPLLRKAQSGDYNASCAIAELKAWGE